MKSKIISAEIFALRQAKERILRNGETMLEMIFSLGKMDVQQFRKIHREVLADCSLICAQANPFENPEELAKMATETFDKVIDSFGKTIIDLCEQNRFDKANSLENFLKAEIIPLQDNLHARWSDFEVEKKARSREEAANSTESCDLVSEENIATAEGKIKTFKELDMVTDFTMRQIDGYVQTTSSCWNAEREAMFQSIGHQMGRIALTADPRYPSILQKAAKRILFEKFTNKFLSEERDFLNENQMQKVQALQDLRMEHLDLFVRHISAVESDLAVLEGITDQASFPKVPQRGNLFLVKNHEKNEPPTQ